MTMMRSALAVLLLLSVPVSRAVEEPMPFPTEETLRYTIEWPSGLGLGEATMSASRSKETGHWSFDFELVAAVPAVKIEDRYRSSATAELCSLEFHKQAVHSKRSAKEKTTIDQEARRAHRVTLDEGGESDMDVPECAKDGLTFLYHLRRELSHGRIPPPQKILFGAIYEVSFEPAGSENVQLGDQMIEADQMMVTVRGPASESIFILLVARDPARTPVRITAPLELGNITMNLAQE